jgi:uncharacterized protein YcbX
MRVAELWRYPVKSLQGERLDAVEAAAQGLSGDRRYAIFDVATGFGLTARRVPEMLFASARLCQDGGVEITLPDGTVAADDGALSAWLGRPVALRSSSEVAERRYENPSDTEFESADSWSPFDGADGAFHDTEGASVTLLSTAGMRGEAARRFRANLVLDGDGEDALIGSRVQVGDALLEVTQPIARCVMVTRAQPGGIERDRDVLRWIHRERAGRLSVGGVVSRAGTIRVGDLVERVGS